MSVLWNTINTTLVNRVLSSGAQRNYKTGDMENYVQLEGHLRELTDALYEAVKEVKE